MYNLNIQKIINVYYRENQTWHRRTFSPRNFDAVVYFTEGKIEYHFHDKSLTAQKGDVLFLPRNIPYCGEKHTDTVGYYVLDFVCAREDEFATFAAPTVFTPKNPGAFRSRFSQALELWSRQQIDIQLKMKSIAYALVSEVFEQESKNKTTVPMEGILEYVLENLGMTSLKVSELCDRFFISESQLRRNFIKATSMTPNEYILAVRIGKAKNELICTEKSIKQIALECGFSSPYYFSRCFSQVENVTPTAYRKQHAYT